MGEYWLPTLPFFNVFMSRVGGVVGTPKNCLDILEHGSPGYGEGFGSYEVPTDHTGMVSPLHEPIA